MRADPQAIAALCPGLDDRIVREHVQRLDDDYLARFDPPLIAEHLLSLSRLSSDRPVDVLLTNEGDRRASCAVLAFDHPFEFSLITGVLASVGLRINSGDVFTLRPATSNAAAPGRGGRPQRRPRHRPTLRAPARDPIKRAVIVDYFSCQFDQRDDFDALADKLRCRMTEVIGLLDRADQASVNKAKRRVNEMVTERLSTLKVQHGTALAPVKLDIDQINTSRTRLKIVAQDTPAFLYSLSTALSLHGLSIERVRIRGSGDHVEDEIHVVDSSGQPIRDKQVLERVKLSVLLTKQFTYFLDQAPDPFAALTRFEQLTEDITQLPQRSQWVDLLSDPRAMQGLAKLLGTSDYLWEDFIRQQSDSLLPIFRPHLEGKRLSQPPETLPLRLEQALNGAADLAERRTRLNKFKDREIFLIDLDHVLTPGSNFRELAERLTFLAENLVTTAGSLVYQDMVRSYGEPKTERGEPCAHAVFGLGKLGGVALGYASDIELLFLYTANGTTTGGKREPISNAEFFEQHARETARFIETKREGIFQVDLRLRPYGNDGPLASSLEQFQQYYCPGGRAHPFEKLALVRLRWIAGDPKLGFEVERLRARFVYDNPQLDMDALWDSWTKHREQKSRPGKLNAKHSPGALVDLEGTVQLLQVMYAQQAPQLRTPRLSGAMEGLRRAGVLSPHQFADLYGAYQFLRRLINSLRMLRGNAQDLFLPPTDSDEFVHLARRMHYVHEAGTGPAQQLFDEFQTRTAAVRKFVEQHFGRPCPGTK